MVRLLAALLIGLIAQQVESSETPASIKSNWDLETFRCYLKNWRAVMDSKTKQIQSSEVIEAPYQPGKPFEKQEIQEYSAAKAAHLRLSPNSSRKNK